MSSDQIAVASRAPVARPDLPRRYHQLLRGPRFCWWRPLVALLVAVPLLVVVELIAFVPVLLVGVLAPAGLDATLHRVTDVNDFGPLGFIYTNLTLVVLIPLAGLSILIAYRTHPGFLASVTRRIRWRWMARCLLVVAPVWVIYMGVGLLVDAPSGPRPAHWGALLVIVVLMTPFQAAGEEVFFRGWLMQNIGACFARPLWGLLVGLVISTAAFAAAHGSPDPWILGSIGCLGVASGLAAWRTGGLEAGIVMHTVNNVLTFFVVILLGGWQQAFVGADTKGTPADLGLAVVVHALALGLVWWQAKRCGIEPRYLPPAPPAPRALPAYASELATWNPIAALNTTV